MGEHDPQGGRPQDALSVAELLVFGHHDLASDHPGEPGHIADADGQNDVEYAGAQNGHQQDGQQDEGEGEHAVHDAHDDRVHHAAGVAGDEPQQDADDAAQHSGADGHHDAHPGAVEEPAEEVAPQVVGAQDMPLGEGRQVGLQDVDLIGVVGGEHRGQHAHEDHQTDDDQTHHGRLVAAEFVPGIVGRPLLADHGGLGLLGNGAVEDFLFHNCYIPPFSASMATFGLMTM